MKHHPYLFLCVLCVLCGSFSTKTAKSQTTNYLHLIVNTNRDNIKPDNELTLREAILITNGALPLEKLTPAEKSQITPTQTPRIDFNLPPQQTAIQLTEELPAITTPNLIIDGATQPGYNPNTSATAEISIPTPIVTITPATNKQILRGITVTADKVTIRGLSLHGFTSRHSATASTPPANIFIAHRLPPPNTTQQQPPAANFPFRNTPPKDVVIENNWLGIPPSEQMPATPSAFGVSIFNAVGTTIQRNRISYQDGSAIITSVTAENTQIKENIIVGNGLAGMPDAIRLEGLIGGTRVTSNLICGNDGSGAYLFKPEGQIEIKDNQIKYNGRRFRRAAVYLMGSNHQVTNNNITNQAGPGVVVTAFPPGGSHHKGAATGNIIQNNRFANLEGLSIDLNTRNHVDVQDFQRGDGKNPPRNSENRRLDTGNAAIKAPEFFAKEFFIINNRVNIDGMTEPNSDVDVYRVQTGALSEKITTVKADAKGKFGATLTDIQPGEIVSAISTNPKYGTSEPAYNAVIRNLGDSSTTSIPNQNTSVQIPKCLTRPKPPEPTPEPTPEPQPLEPIRLKVPRNIHFALDKDFVSKSSTKVLITVAAVMQQYPSIVIELQGHTDARASDAYNKDLAQRRAINSRNYLIKKGIAPERMTIRSFGERQLKTPGRDRVEHARNRRVEIMFFDIRGIEIILEDQENDLQIEN